MIRNILGKASIGLTAGCVAGLLTLGVGCDDDETNPGVDGGLGGAGAVAGGGVGGGVGGAGGGAAGDAGTFDTGAGGATQIVTVTDDITADTLWTADKTYQIAANRKLYVRAPATLTIQAGTKVQGLTKSALLVQRGAKLQAVGTAQAPIVFTSAKPVGTRAPGNWGGIVLLGRAPINTARAQGGVETAFEATAGDPGAIFGGNDPMDSSGTLKYVRIEFAGEEYQPDKEFNGLTLCGVGRGTVLDHIQVHKGSDDGIEFFGGTVDVKYLVSSQNQDDGFDTDNGWQGRGQFIVIQHIDPKGSDPSNGYESDNHGTSASYKAEPRTLPTVYNATLIGKKDYAMNSWGLVLRRGTGGKYYNHIIMDFKNGLVETRDADTKEQLDANNLFVKNSIWFQSVATNPAFPVPQQGPNVVDIEETPYFTKAEWANRAGVDPMLTDPYSLTAPNFAPKAGSPALTGAATPEASADNFFDTTATFVGAVGATDWTVGWTAYPAN